MIKLIRANFSRLLKDKVFLIALTIMAAQQVHSGPQARQHICGQPYRMHCGGAIQIDKAARELIHLRDEIAAEKDGIPPKTLIVLCALTNAAYQRPDGVYVVPITALKD